MAIDYALEKLSSAINTLIFVDYPLRKRLLSAMSDDIGMIHLERDLPENLRGTLDDINKIATKYSSYEGTMNSMEDREVKEIVEKIIELFKNVCAIESMSIHPHDDYNR